jgi:glycosyltransferase involved in cell wall biosynthesis
MKILLRVNVPIGVIIGGAEVYSEQLYNLLVELGHQVDVLVRGERSQGRDYDLVIINDWDASYWNLESIPSGQKVIVVVHDNFPFTIKMITETQPKSVTFVALSNPTTEVMSRYGHLYKVIPNFSRLEGLEGRKPAVDLPEKYGLVVSRPTAEKGIRESCEFLQRMNLTPVYVGGWVDVPIVRELENSGVVVAGMISDPRELAYLYDHACVLAHLPTFHPEASPLVIWESLSRGTPVIANKRCNIVEEWMTFGSRKSIKETYYSSYSRNHWGARWSDLLESLS